MIGKSITPPQADDPALKLAVIGLGYVGLPLAVEFGRVFDTLGFDIDPVRIDQLRAGHDHTLEVESAELAAIDFFTGDAALNVRLMDERHVDTEAHA